MEKLAHQSGGDFKDSDYFPFWYCENYFRQLDWLKKFPKNSWSVGVWPNPTEGFQLARKGKERSFGVLLD